MSYDDHTASLLSPQAALNDKLEQNRAAVNGMEDQVMELDTYQEVQQATALLTTREDRLRDTQHMISTLSQEKVGKDLNPLW